MSSAAKKATKEQLDIALKNCEVIEWSTEEEEENDGYSLIEFELVDEKDNPLNGELFSIAHADGELTCDCEFEIAGMSNDVLKQHIIESVGDYHQKLFYLRADYPS